MFVTRSAAPFSGLAGANLGNITDCYAVGNISISINTYAGGLIGLNSGNIINCYAMVNICTAAINGEAAVGGLIGLSRASNVINCYATGDIRATSSLGFTVAGGLIGGGFGEVRNCYAMGNVILNVNLISSGEGFVYAGGLLGGIKVI